MSWDAIYAPFVKIYQRHLSRERSTLNLNAPTCKSWQVLRASRRACANRRYEQGRYYLFDIAFYFNSHRRADQTARQSVHQKVCVHCRWGVHGLPGRWRWHLACCYRNSGECSYYWHFSQQVNVSQTFLFVGSLMFCFVQDNPRQ